MKLLTVKDLSTLLSVKESTLYSWAAKGSIPSLKLNGLLRFDMKEISEWIKMPRKDVSKREKITKKSCIITTNCDIDKIIRKSIADVKDKGI